MKYETLNQRSNYKQDQSSTLFKKEGNTPMLKALTISLVTLISGLALAAQPLNDIALKALEAENQFIDNYNTSTIHGFAELEDISTLAAEAETQFINDYVINSTHGFAEEKDIAVLATRAENQLIDSYVTNTIHGFADIKDLAVLAAELENQFINEYVANTTHGFGITPSFPQAEAQVELVKVALLNEDFVSCVNAMAQLSIESCLGAVREAEFINDYVAGNLH